MVSGDISAVDGQKAAQTYFQPWVAGASSPAGFEIKLPAAPTKRRVVLVDNPNARQSSIRIGIPAYSIASDEKFAGSLAGQMLSSGIDSRLGKYVRAEKGYVYGVQAIFSPSRQAGAFIGATDTKFTTTADTIEAMFKVFDDMKAANVPNQELFDAKSRVAGGLLMTMETIGSQASRRVDGILNGYPIDYYDKYSQRISQVTAENIRTVMNKYVLEDRMVIVVVAPASVVKTQLERLGTVEVLPMPSGQ
jgi:predicted Zn-dependent peptidase